MRKELAGRLTAILLPLLPITASAAGCAGGVEEAVHTMPLNGNAEYCQRVGSIATKGISLIGVVTKSTSINPLLIISHADTTRKAICNTRFGSSNKSADLSGDVAMSDSLLIYTATMGMSDTDTLQLNSKIHIGDRETGRYKNPFAQGSGDGGSGQKRATFVEYSLYGRILTPIEKRKVESCLALRNGITLNQTRPNSYLNATGDTVWNAVQSKEYNHSIAGICRDDKSNLLLKESQSISRGVTPKISAKDSLKDGMYLVWSDNGGTTKPQKDGKMTIMERKWKFTTTGDWTGVPLSIRYKIGGQDGLPEIKEGERYYITLSQSDSIDSDITEYGGVLCGKDTVEFSNVKLGEGMSFMSVSSGLVSDSDNMSQFQYINIYPNPTPDGYVDVEIGLWQVEPVEIALYDYVGQIMRLIKLKDNQYYKSTLFLPMPGVYMIKVNLKDETKTEKVIRK